MERIKRPYTKRSSFWNKQDNTGSSNGKTTDFESVNGSSNLPPVAIHDKPIIKKVELYEYTYNDLPKSVKDKIEKDLTYRRKLKLPDDSQERKDKALKYFIFKQKRSAK
jgi:hypothetical protein